ncbi:hypothetical protein SAMN06265349_102973 [Flavobacterium resistens]|uniref:Uncharacterized protein n=1 Tax=Flavobacterium resistens TaxID=443612 RepID=A0A521CXY7_9FLAO|nr:hypothetical protein [Flavobacterium resistens]MRX67039.1 hypothetical protein [Flavobacterium resistens]SMO63611.1 hypothetical protein SAMN06265349_102973 [Flavobacterium resistens]
MKPRVPNFYEILILLLFPLYGFTQPSRMAEVHFIFYDKSQEVSKEVLTDQYKLLTSSSGNYNPANYRYDNPSKTSIISETIVYNDVHLLIVHQKDTMQLIFKTKGAKRLKFKVDRLDFKQGTFVIDNEATTMLDFKNNKSTYYNYILSILPKNIYNIEENHIYAELKKLKLRYGIKEDDLSTKKENQLVEISTLSEPLILKKYKAYLSEADAGENDIIDDGKVYHSPDHKIRIFVFERESCGAHCNIYYNSFIHFNLDKKIPNSLATAFFPIDAILKLNNDNYLVLQTGVDGGGIDINENKIATLIQFKNEKISIGKTYVLPDLPTSEKLKSISVIRDTMSEAEKNKDYFLKFDPKTNILQYRYWRYLNDEQTKKKVYSGKFIFDGDCFRVL